MQGAKSKAAFEATYSAWKKLGLSTRAAGALAAEAITTMAELRQLGRKRLLTMSNVGNITRAEIEALRDLGSISAVQAQKKQAAYAAKRAAYTAALLNERKDAA